MSVRFSVYIVCTPVLSCNNFKLSKTLAVKNISIQEKCNTSVNFSCASVRQLSNNPAHIFSGKLLLFIFVIVDLKILNVSCVFNANFSS